MKRNDKIRLILGWVLSASTLILGGCASRQAHTTTTAVVGSYPDDQSLNARARSALYGDPEFKFDGVNVTSYGRTVQLSGYVYTREEKREAAKIVKHVPGVEVVQNNIAVTGSPAD